MLWKLVMIEKNEKNILKILISILDIDQKLTGIEYLKEFIKNIALNLDVKYVLIGHPIDEVLSQIQTDAVWANGNFADNFMYQLKDTPCELVLTGERVCIHDMNVAINFPEDKLLQEMGIEAYVGAPVVSSTQSEVSSILVLLDDKPMKDRNFFISITDFLALRASAELEKSRIEENLSNQVILRTSELEISNKKLTKTNKKLTKTLSQLKKTQDRLIESEKLSSLGGLVSGVAHEINTPLGVALTGITYFEDISLSIQKLYSEEHMSKEDFEKYLNESKNISTQVLRNIKRASELVRTFKQVSADQESEEKREFYIKDYTDGIILSVYNQIKKTQIKVENNIPSDIKINNYPGAFGQIITNLIINSLVHGYATNDKGTISLNLQKEDNKLILHYKDDGKGINEKDLPHIFEPFFTTKRGLGGTGLGLNILHNIIKKQFGGYITCNSKPNKGVDFEMVFPLFS